MNEKEILEKFKEQDIVLQAIYQSVEKTRRYFLWTLIASIVTFVLPLIGLIIIVPIVMNNISKAYGL